MSPYYAPGGAEGPPCLHRGFLRREGGRTSCATFGAAERNTRAIAADRGSGDLRGNAPFSVQDDCRDVAAARALFAAGGEYVQASPA